MRVDLWVPDLFATGYHRGIWPAAASVAEVRMIFDLEHLDDWADVTVVVRPTKRHEASYVEALAARGRAVVVDLDDDLWSIPASNPASRILDPYYSPDESWAQTTRAARAATLVTVTTPQLAKRFDNAVVLENCVREPDLSIPATDSAGVWWPGAPFSHADNLDVLISLASRLRVEGVPIGVVGIRDGLGARFATTEQDVTATGFVPFDRWMPTVAQIGVGLAPLAPTTFNLSKSWLRPLQMAAVGVPFVGSRWGEYERLGAGVLVDRPDDWYDAVSLLVHSEAYRADLAATGRRVASEWTYERRAWRWAEAWESAIAKAGRVHA